MGQFAIDVAKFAEKAKAKGDVVTRKIAIDLLSRVVMRSPVGNPELWAVNSHAAYGRETHNMFVAALNATLAPGEKPVRRMGKKKLKETYKLTSGKGYVGGRFKGNWQVTIGTAPTQSLDSIDPSGAATITDGRAALASFKAGMPIFITNNLPYGPRLEYEGWSKQAPAGMVRVSIAEFQNITIDAVKALP